MDQDRRIATAQAAWTWISRADGHIEPSLLARRFLAPLDHGRVGFATPGALALPEPARIVEVVTPLVQIAATILAGNGRVGPARSAANVLHIFDGMAGRVWVSPDEHALLSRVFSQTRWDARHGDAWARYHAAGLTFVPVQPEMALSA